MLVVMVQYSTVQYSAVQCSAVQCSAVQYSTVQNFTLGHPSLLPLHRMMHSVYPIMLYSLLFTLQPPYSLLGFAECDLDYFTLCDTRKEHSLLWSIRDRNIPCFRRYGTGTFPALFDTRQEHSLLYSLLKTFSKLIR
jgi:hypothetical protein